MSFYEQIRDLTEQLEFAREGWRNQEQIANEGWAAQEAASAREDKTLAKIEDIRSQWKIIKSQCEDEDGFTSWSTIRMDEILSES